MSEQVASKRGSRFLQDYAVVIAFLVIFFASAVWQPEFFLKPENLRNLLSQNAHIGIIAIGMTLVIIAGGIDLSVGSMVALVGSVGMLALNKMAPGGEGAAVWAAVGITIALGTLAGFVNGALVSFGKIAPFVATLAGLSAYRSLALVLGEGGEIRSLSSSFPGLAEGGFPLPFLQTDRGQPILLTWPILAFLVVAIIFATIMARTAFGRHVVAVGANPRAAHYSAISVKRVRVLTYVLLGFCVGIATLIMTSRMNSVATGSLGVFYELDAIAAVAVGGTSLAGGRGRVWGTVIGVLLLGIINNMLILGDVSVYWQGFVKGVIIVLAVLVQRRREEG